MLLVLLATLFLSTDIAAELSGRVVTNEGTPIANAMVVVSTAKPKQGPATVCPTCYPDCGKRVTTDMTGAFRIEGLSPSLEFTLTAGAIGYQATQKRACDPAEQAKVQLILVEHPANGGEDTDITRLKGHVTDLQGRPVVGVQVQSSLPYRNDGIARRSDPSLTEIALTNDRGEFEFSVGSKVSGFYLQTSAAGFAPERIQWSRYKETTLNFKLGRGADIRGRLVFEGKPVRDVELGLIQKDRSVNKVVTQYEIVTDESGRFHFEGIPPSQDYVLYTLVGQGAPAVLPVTLAAAPGRGERAEFGEIELSSPSVLVVTIQTVDGSSLPAGSSLSLSRDNASHRVKIPLAPRSTEVLTFSDLSKQPIAISLRVPGFEVDQTRPPTNIDQNRHYNVAIEGDTDLLFLLRRKQ